MTSRHPTILIGTVALQCRRLHLLWLLVTVSVPDTLNSTVWHYPDLVETLPTLDNTQVLSSSLRSYVNVVCTSPPKHFIESRHVTQEPVDTRSSSPF
jgi:hypothetical protein